MNMDASDFPFIWMRDDGRADDEGRAVMFKQHRGGDYPTVCCDDYGGRRQQIAGPDQGSNRGTERGDGRADGICA